jgi:uncharacterized protein YqjF (DUF2071 family)
MIGEKDSGMAFYIRKSLSLGPIRLNFSKSGVGISAGVRGARVGINSRGKRYIHAGRHGIYYRQMLDGANEPNDLKDHIRFGAPWFLIMGILIGLMIAWLL